MHIYSTNTAALRTMSQVTYVNSAFYPSRAGKSSVGMTGWGEGGVCSLVSGRR